jgi:membrane fusion protein (multidrug efflux system)
VKKGDLMFKIEPDRNAAKLDAELADVRLAQLELDNAKKLFEDKVVGKTQVSLHEAKLAKALAKADLARAESNPTILAAPFDGIVGRLQEQLGSFVKEGDRLTTLSDNSVIWVYFNVPEKRYLEYMTNRDMLDDGIELMLADQTKFPQRGRLNAVEADFDNQSGNIAFRADFPNPNGLLRHGQSGTILIHRKLHNATVIPMRAAYEIMDQRYVYVVDKDDVARLREIVPQHEMDDIYVIKQGVGVGDRIVLEGFRQVRNGEKVEYEFRPPEEVMRKPRNDSQ